MATMKFLMKQDSSTIESVVRTFRLSRGQRNFLLAARRGEGLFATKNWTPMEVVASPKEAEMANTTLQASTAHATNIEDSIEQLEYLANGHASQKNGRKPPNGQTVVQGSLTPIDQSRRD